MGIASDIAEDWHASLAALAWQVDLGATEVIGDAPLNRYDLPEAAKPLPRMAVVAEAEMSAPSIADPVAAAEAAADAAQSLPDLRAALDGFEPCELKKGARNLVFGQGQTGARVLILADAPAVEDDREGACFVGAAGGLLDRMFAAIGMARDSSDPTRALYLTHVSPWRAPQDRALHRNEIAMLQPFVARHIGLVNPDVIVTMGSAAQAALLQADATPRARGQWGQALGKPVLSMTHPRLLLRTPAAKREAWADLLALQAKLRG